MSSYDFAIVGGGILGIATAYQLQKKHPRKTIVVFEKDDLLAEHQTGSNSGVIHSGLYYKPGSKKAELCMKGKHDLVEFAKKYNVPHDICGKVVVATEEKEIPILEKIFENGKANGCEGIELISGEQIQEKEPFVVGVKGIWVPSTGIIDYRKMTEVMAKQLILLNPNSKILTNHKVKKVEIVNNESIITSNQKEFSAKFVVFCGGLQADRLAKKDKVKLDLKIVPFRGDYYNLTELGMHKVKNLIYPVPDPEFPFLGVHFTRMVVGGVECGPNAVFSFKREGYKRSDFSLRDAFDALSYVGLWKFFSKHWKKGLLEYKRAYSKKLFLQTLQKMIPSLTMEDIKPARSGVRAQALNADGDLVYDFKIENKHNHFHVLNAPSPAATACLSIGKYISDTVSKKL
jgi:L-2-hydroxyglutarate oxidase